MVPGIRTVAFALGIALVAAACGSGGDGVRQATDEPGDGAPTALEAGVVSALDDPDSDSFPEPIIDPDLIISGGPPPDGIPPIDDPSFVAADDVDFLADNEPVLALTVGDESRAYPVQVLIWHEIVNDTIDNIPVTVTYCPLCNSAIAYDRRLDDRVLDFGTSGQLYNSALVMYDRQTESLWSHFTGQAVVGNLTGETLEVFPMTTVSWAAWRDANPDGMVLSRDTGFDRAYGQNPYPGYDDVDTAPFLFQGDTDERLAAKERVLGIESDGDALAIQLDSLRNDGVRSVEVGDEDLVAWVVGGTSSALDTASIEFGRDVGATGVFSRRVDDQLLNFEPDGDGFVDTETASTWDVFGEATGGPLAGTQLDAVAHVDTFWFAWAAFRPDTVIER